MNLDLNYIRKQFPALNSGYIYFDNAGGSQILKSVVNGHLSSEIVEKVDPYHISIRFGDFYARRLIETMDLVKKR